MQSPAISPGFFIPCRIAPPMDADAQSSKDDQISGSLAFQKKFFKNRFIKDIYHNSCYNIPDFA